MRRLLVLLAALGACTRPAPPQYMQDIPKTQDAAKAAIAEIKKELGDAFAVEQLNEIFFVASDDSKWSFDSCKATINRIYTFLTSAYFKKKPTRPLRVYLFRDKESYDSYVKRSTGKDPTTPFGFYLSGERKMVMNISTGTGTLAHELAHPLLAEDFPEVPAWFNEGFASLFEMSTTSREGRVVGLVNWRLPGLQQAMRKGAAISLPDLVKTNIAQFYADNSGVNYATARYLVYWLQEKDLLLKFYNEFKATVRADGTGRAALEAVLGRKLDEFEPEWREFVKKLEYRR